MADAARLHWPREEAVLGCLRGRTAWGRRLRRGQCSGCEEVGDQVSVGAEHLRSPVGRRPRITIPPTTNLGRWAVGLAVAFFSFVFAAVVVPRSGQRWALLAAWLAGVAALPSRFFVGTRGHRPRRQPRGTSDEGAGFSSCALTTSPNQRCPRCLGAADGRRLRWLRKEVVVRADGAAYEGSSIGRRRRSGVRPHWRRGLGRCGRR